MRKSLRINLIDLPITIRIALAENINTPSTKLAVLAEDECIWVRCKVAQNLNTSQTVLTKLAKDIKPEVRIEVAKNPNTPDKVLKKLSEDDNSLICEPAFMNLKLKKYKK